MISIYLLNNSIKKYDHPVTAYQVISSISNNLSRNAIAVKINDKLADISTLINQDAKLEIITNKSKDGLHIIRHSTAHLLAYAVKSLYPEANIVTGPVIKDGFYYDFSFKRPFNINDIKNIEEHMREIVKKNEIITHRIVSRNEAIQYFNSINEKYKEKLIKLIPVNEKITLYSHGTFVDLCKGPHVNSMNKLKIFKITKVSGVFWQGNTNNEQLQRIYGTAWATQEDQNKYFDIILEKKKRDHRKIGRELNLFHVQDELPGMIFWHPNGWILWRQIETYIRSKLFNSGYVEIKTPIIMNKSLWKSSGHWDNYKENMFTTSSEKNDYAIKPMNCPGHVQIFNNTLRSYRDLPLRYSEFGSCHRNEPSGSLHGLMRVREFVQDDAHIFCMPKQLISESISFNSLVMNVYKDFGFNDIDIKLSLCPKIRFGSDEIWKKAETELREALIACNLKWEELPGEGAFYGPKVEYHIKDAIGRLWQCGTLQLDMILPEKLCAEYIDSDGSKKNPIMLHRAILGSMERFIGILIEHYSGSMPVWLSPIQAIVLNISDKHISYSRRITNVLIKEGFRVGIDLRNEKINYKIRKYLCQKIPYLLIIGDIECNTQTISVRMRGTSNSVKMEFNEFVNNLKKDIILLR